MKKRLMKTMAVACLLGVTWSAHALTPVSPADKQAQVAGFYQHDFGPYQITALLDGTNHLSRALFKGVSDTEVNAILSKYYVDQAKGIQTSVNAFLINDGKQLSLVDSGAASCFGTHLGSIKKNLQASGHKPEDVKQVFLTHLHPDHVCGIANQGVAEFPNATLHIAKQEYDYWMSAATLASISTENHEKFLGTVSKIKAALAPYEQKKQVKLFGSKALQVGGVNIQPSQGHTPGHHGFVLRHGGQELVFIGDIVHSHTIQFDKPATAIEFDVDPIQAVTTRLQHFAKYAQEGQTIAAPHLPFPGIGHIYSQDGKSYQWVPIHFKD